MQSSFFKDDDPYSEPPDIFELFRFYNYYFFNNILHTTIIKWSKRMTLCAGTCKYEGQKSCTITLSEPLLKYRSNNELKETVLHEMIHAYLFITSPGAEKINEGHGPQFISLMEQINRKTGLNITVFHQFHDEVDRCRNHIWRCNGKCQKEPPYFGFVKRAMNRAPGKSDNWFAQHQVQCGGEFIKISEPEKTNNNNKRKPQQKKDDKIRNVPLKKISSYFKKENFQFSYSFKTTSVIVEMNILVNSTISVIELYQWLCKVINYLCNNLEIHSIIHNQLILQIKNEKEYNTLKSYIKEKFIIIEEEINLSTTTIQVIMLRISGNKECEALLDKINKL